MYLIAQHTLTTYPNIVHITQSGFLRANTVYLANLYYDIY